MIAEKTYSFQDTYDQILLEKNIRNNKGRTRRMYSHKTCIRNMISEEMNNFLNNYDQILLEKI